MLRRSTRLREKQPSDSKHDGSDAATDFESDTSDRILRKLDSNVSEGSELLLKKHVSASAPSTMSFMDAMKGASNSAGISADTSPLKDMPDFTKMVAPSSSASLVTSPAKASGQSLEEKLESCVVEEVNCELVLPKATQSLSAEPTTPTTDSASTTTLTAFSKETEVVSAAETSEDGGGGDAVIDASTIGKEVSGESAMGEKKEEEEKSSEKEEADGDWQWGCCDGQQGDRSVKCDGDACNRWWHISCLLNRFGEKQSVVDRIGDIEWKCPHCTSGLIADEDFATATMHHSVATDSSSAAASAMIAAVRSQGTGSNQSGRRPVRASRTVFGGYVDYDSDSDVSSVDSDSDDDLSAAGMDAFMEGMDLTPAERKQMEDNRQAQQSAFNAAMKKQRAIDLNEIKNQFKVLQEIDISDEEAAFSLDFCKKHQIDAWQKIEDEGGEFIELVRTQLCDRRKLELIEEQRKQLEAQRKSRRKNADSDFELSDSEFESDSEYDEDDDSEEDSESDAGLVRKSDFLSEVEKRRRAEARRKRGLKKGMHSRPGRLLLDDAMKTKDTFEGWSLARIKAFKNKTKNPNQYYYRFLDEGVEQGHGGFTKEEHTSFMHRMEDFGVNMAWGEFSIAIPQRVGYQCSNYFRELVKKRWVTDPNYSIESDGKLKFKRGISRYKRKYDANHLERSFSFTVHKDPSKVWTSLPANHSRCPQHYRYNDSGVIASDDDEEMDEAGNGAKTEEQTDVEMADATSSASTAAASSSSSSSMSSSAGTVQKVQYKVKKEKAKKKKSKKKKKKESGDEEGVDGSEANTPFSKAKSKSKKRKKKSKAKKGKAKSGGGADKKKRRKKRKNPASDLDEDGGDNSPPTKRRKTRETDAAYVCKVKTDSSVDPSDENPLPDFIDSITQCVVVKPTMSPFGHVLGYDTWTRLLRRPECKDTCPFTRKTMTRRSLQKLTKENIDEFKDQIQGVTDEELRNLSSLA